MSALCSLYLISYEFLYGSFFYTMILAQISGLLLLSQTKQFLHLTSQNSFHNYVLGSYIDFYACLIIIILAYWPDLRTVNLSVCTYDCILRAESKTGNYLECKTPPPTHTHTGLNVWKFGFQIMALFWKVKECHRESLEVGTEVLYPNLTSYPLWLLFHHCERVWGLLSAYSAHHGATCNHDDLYPIKPGLRIIPSFFKMLLVRYLATAMRKVTNTAGPPIDP